MVQETAQVIPIIEKGYWGRVSPILLFLGLTIFEIGYLNYDFHRSDAMQYIAAAVYIVHLISAWLIFLIASGLKSLTKNQQRGWVIAYYTFMAQTTISALGLNFLSALIFLLINVYTDYCYQKYIGGTKLTDVLFDKGPKKTED